MQLSAKLKFRWRGQEWPIILGLYLLATTLRAKLIFGSVELSGLNGSYYLVQVRGLMERASLPFSDLPLLFYLQKILVLMLEMVGAGSTDELVLMGVRLFDALVPSLVVVPIYILGRQLTKSSPISRILSVFAAVIVSTSYWYILMIADYQKNSLGLLLFAGFILALSKWDGSRNLKRCLPAAILFLAIGFTHVGVLGWAIVWTGFFMIVVWAISPSGQGVAKWLAGSMVLVALLVGFILPTVDPERAYRLQYALQNPVSFAGQLHDWKCNKRDENRCDFIEMMPGFAPPQPRWGQIMALQNEIGLPFALVGILTLCLFWRERKKRDLNLGQRGGVLASALTLILLMGPWVADDKLIRFQYNAILLLIVCGLFILSTLSRPYIALALAVMGVSVSSMASFFAYDFAKVPLLHESAVRELHDMRAVLPDSSRSLVVAKHGLGWSVAWNLRVHVVPYSSLHEEAWANYDHVFFLRTLNCGLKATPRSGPFMEWKRAEFETPVHEGRCFALTRVEKPFVRDWPNLCEKKIKDWRTQSGLEILPEGEEVLRHFYGENESQVKSQLIHVVFLNQVTRFSYGMGAARALEDVGVELQERAKTDPDLHDFLRPFLTGEIPITHMSFIWRKVAGTDAVSTHGFGIAMDMLNREREGLYYWREASEGLPSAVESKRVELPPALVEVFERYGFRWGGRWDKFDIMHFEYRPELMPDYSVACYMPKKRVTPMVRLFLLGRRWQSKFESYISP
jgi:hypothetical protein